MGSQNTLEEWKIFMILTDKEGKEVKCKLLVKI